MVILVKRIKINFENYDFREINGLFKKAVESVPKNEFISEIHVSRDRENDEYLVAIRPHYEDSKMRVDGFELIDGTCKTCLQYAGDFTHDFMRGSGGECFIDGNFRAPYEQCEWYENRMQVIKEFHKAVKDAEDERDKKAEQIFPDVKKGLEDIKKSIESVGNKEIDKDEESIDDQI